jgi:hypothetical protein
MRFNRRSLLLALPGVPLACASENSQSPTGNSMPAAIVFAQGQFVAVGTFFVGGSLDGGGIGVTRTGAAAWLSMDGRSFEPVRLPAGGSGVAFGQGRLVAVLEGIAGAPDGVVRPVAGMSTSQDARSWSEEPAPRPLSSIAFGNGRFVAVGSSGLGATSEDGLQWQPIEVPVLLPRRLAFGNGHFVAYGDGDTLALSEDGATWRTQRLVADVPASLITNISFVQSRGFLGTSVHRGAEEETNPPIGWIESPDGVTWSVKVGFGADHLTAVDDLVERNGRLVAVRADGMATSDDGGQHWVLRLGRSHLRAVAAGPPGFVAVGDGVLVTSTDAEHWELHSALVPPA